MAKTTPFLMLRTMTMSEAKVLSGKDKGEETVPPGE
jgi:hypothetical protein